MTPEQIAADYDLPVEAVREAIAYCQSKPPEIEEDFQREAALIEAKRKKDSCSKYPREPRVLAPEEPERIDNS